MNRDEFANYYVVKGIREELERVGASSADVQETGIFYVVNPSYFSPYVEYQAQLAVKMKRADLLTDADEIHEHYWEIEGTKFWNSFFDLLRRGISIELARDHVDWCQKWDCLTITRSIEKVRDLLTLYYRGEETECTLDTHISVFPSVKLY